MSCGQNLVHGEGTYPEVGSAPIGFAVPEPWTNLPQGIVLGIVLGWAPIGFAVMATP